MKKAISTLAISTALVLGACVAAAQVVQQPGSSNGNVAQQPIPNGAGPQASATATPNYFTQEEGGRIVQEVQHKLLTLNDYDVFDSLSFGIQGKTIILQGFASRPQLKSEAESAIKRIKGVEKVDNQIKVLPYSPNDDRIRIGAYQRIYGAPSLRKYTSAPVGFGRQPSVALAAGGITNDPPLGYHSIHIIVDNGHITLTGVVDSKSDSEVANIQANSTPGAFSVTNQLQIAGKPNVEK